MKPLIALSSRDRKVNTTEAYYLQQSPEVQYNPALQFS